MDFTTPNPNKDQENIIQIIKSCFFEIQFPGADRSPDSPIPLLPLSRSAPTMNAVHEYDLDPLIPSAIYGRLARHAARMQERQHAASHRGAPDSLSSAVHDLAVAASCELSAFDFLPSANPARHLLAQRLCRLTSFLTSLSSSSSSSSSWPRADHPKPPFHFSSASSQKRSQRRQNQLPSYPYAEQQSAHPQSGALDSAALLGSVLHLVDAAAEHAPEVYQRVFDLLPAMLADLPLISDVAPVVARFLTQAYHRHAPLRRKTSEMMLMVAAGFPSLHHSLLALAMLFGLRLDSPEEFGDASAARLLLAEDALLPTSALQMSPETIAFLMQAQPLQAFAPCWSHTAQNFTLPPQYASPSLFCFASDLSALYVWQSPVISKFTVIANTPRLMRIQLCNCFHFKFFQFCFKCFIFI